MQQQVYHLTHTTGVVRKVRERRRSYIKGYDGDVIIWRLDETREEKRHRSDDFVTTRLVPAARERSVSLLYSSTIATVIGASGVAKLVISAHAVYEDGVKQEITNFATPEAPITVAMILEYSKLSNYMGGNPYEPGSYEILRPAALFLSRFVRPPDDYVSVIAYDIRPTPLTDFTNDPTRINQVISLLLRNYPAFSEANLFDALKFTLIGGRGDSVVLDNSKEREAEYGGLASVTGRRKAILLVSSGIDTFSKINYGEARKIAQNAGVPIYIIGTGNLFFKKYGDMMGATDGPFGPRHRAACQFFRRRTL